MGLLEIQEGSYFTLNLCIINVAMHKAQICIIFFSFKYVQKRFLFTKHPYMLAYINSPDRVFQ